jgi:hypothetical protein
MLAFRSHQPDAEMLAIRRANESRLVTLPGVTGVGLGYREESGKLYDELALRIYAPDRACVAPILPREIRGLPVCVVEDRFEMCQMLPPDETRYRNLKGGIRIGSPSTSTIVLKLGYGTMGALVRDRGSATGELLGLTCFHVVGLPQAFPEIVFQPDHPPIVVRTTIPRDDSIGAVLRVSFPQTPDPSTIPPRLVGPRMPLYSA